MKYPQKPERPIPPFKMRRKDFEKSKKKPIYHLRNTEFSLVPPFLQSKLGNKFRRLHLVFLWKFVPDLILAGFDWFLVRRPAIWDPLYRLTIFKKSLLFTLLCIKKFVRFFQHNSNVTYLEFSFKHSVPWPRENNKN